VPLNPNTTGQLKSDPHRDISRFVDDNGSVPEQRLDVAIALARSMSKELHSALAQWEAPRGEDWSSSKSRRTTDGCHSGAPGQG